METFCGSLIKYFQFKNIQFNLFHAMTSIRRNNSIKYYLKELFCSPKDSYEVAPIQFSKVKLYRFGLVFYILVFSTMMIDNPILAQWIQQGPSLIRGGGEGMVNPSVVGAVQCVAPHPTNANILYIGAVNGGVWRTTNATTTSPLWEFISGDFPSQCVGALEFDPTNSLFQTIVVGLGQFSSFGRFGIGRKGVFRTTNGGSSWNNIDANGIFENANITGIAARGAIIVATTDNEGIWRTIDTGGAAPI